MENTDTVNVENGADATEEQIQARFEEIKAAANQENITTEAKPEATTTTETPNVTTATTEEKSIIWDADDLLSEVKTPTEVKEVKDVIVDDFKAKYEQLNGKIESNKLLKQLMDVADAPDFDYEKFIEAQVSKKVDYEKLPLENLYKASLAADTVAGYTEEEIDEMWESKKNELTSTEQKTLKSELVNKFKSNDTQDSQEEPETIKAWKQSKQQAQEAAVKEQEVWNNLNTEIEGYSKSIVGKKLAGVVITEEDAKELLPSLTLSKFTEKDENGNNKLNGKKISDIQLKGIMFDKVVAHLTKNATKEAMQKITRPNSEAGGHSAVDTDGRSANERMLDEYAQSMGLKSHKDLT